MPEQVIRADEILTSLTPEQREIARGLKTKEELLNFIEEGGFELSDEQLSQIAGGTWGKQPYQWTPEPCKLGCPGNH